MEIFVYRGEWGLPSIDYECSRLLAYLKFSGAKVTVNFNGNPFSSPNGMLPYMIADGKKIAGYGRIVEHLVAAGIGPPTATDRAENVADESSQHATQINGYMQYVQENLHPYFMYMLWGDPKNVDTTRTVYAKRIPIPFNFYCPRKYVLRTNDITQSLVGFSLEDSIEFHDVAEFQHNAKTCLNWVAARLEESRWFTGDRPTEVDALLYGYLSVLLKLTLPNNVLQNHIRQCPKLMQFVDRTTATYFAKEGFNSFTASGHAGNGQQKGTSTGSPNDTSSSSSASGGERSEKSGNDTTFHTGQQQDPDDGPKERRKRYILSGLVATVAMLGYAVLNGILTLPSDRSHGDFLQYDDPGDYDDDDN
ncbi:AGAP003981-PA [Anopheles gambiae str. PEST]|uniref:AGAP003981-PA n=2 Tax=gambiae species complex TaxID=44542 RepID=Q7Q284_ANOGA|nr:metaxin-1 homolog [Anopheles coluzzii]EAA13637.5 AGAP003981-PA [Anopheles gambiae str. PEST]